MQILSGTFEGKTLGTPICLWVKNEDARPEAYEEMKTKFRPSHADYTYFAKYGIRNWQGGGRTSARETVGRVAAGAIAKKLLRERYGVEILAYVKQVQRIVADVNPDKVQSSRTSRRTSCAVRTKRAAAKMIRLIEKMRRAGDTRRRHRRRRRARRAAGWGEPVFDRLEADLAKAMLSLPASKGFEIGSGFGGRSAHRHAAQRSVPVEARQGLHDDQPLRRHSGRHLQRPDRSTSASRSNPSPPSCTSRTRWTASSATPR